MPITGHAARTALDESEWLASDGQTLFFTQDHTSATHFTVETQPAKKISPKQAPIAQQSISDLPYDIVIWDTDAATNDAISQYENASDEHPLLKYFQGLSILSLNHSSNNNATYQLNENTELWNPNVENHGPALALQIENTNEYLSVMQFWHKYGKNTLTVLLILTLLRLLIRPTYAKFKHKQHQKSRRGMRKGRHRNQSKSNPSSDQPDTLPLSKHGKLIKENNTLPPASTPTKNNVKRPRHKQKIAHASAARLSIHGRALAIKPKDAEPKHSSQHRHKHRIKPKPPLLQQIIDVFFYKPDT